MMYVYGFGLRCIDAIRYMEPIIAPAPAAEGFGFEELPQGGQTELLALNNALIDHLGHSPTFMRFKNISAQEMLARDAASSPRYFVAKVQGEIAAYIKITNDGENFATLAQGMQNICGAYCAPQYRGGTLYTALLNHVISVLHAEGNTRLGVDFESFNPTAYRYWTKHFFPYTYGVVRRVDESALPSAQKIRKHKAQLQQIKTGYGKALCMRTVVTNNIFG